MHSHSISGRSIAVVGSLLLASLLTACGGGNEQTVGADGSHRRPWPRCRRRTTRRRCRTSPRPSPQTPVTPPVASTPPPAQTPPIAQRPVQTSALLSWLPPTANTDGTSLATLAGYRIYYGTDANALTQVIDVTNPGLTSYTIGELKTGTYYFAISAYTTDGLEGEKSTVGSKTIG